MLDIDLTKVWQQFVYNPKEPLIFSSGFFLFLFALFMVIYFAVYKHHRAKTTFVTLFSLYFYYKSSGIYFFLLVAATVVDYSLANIIFHSPKKSVQKAVLILSLVLNLGLLAYFKPLRSLRYLLTCWGFFLYISIFKLYARHLQRYLKTS